MHVFLVDKYSVSQERKVFENPIVYILLITV